MAITARAGAAFGLASDIAEEDVLTSRALGEQGWRLIADSYDAQAQHRPVNVLTHCNAGWLAAVDWGTALAPIYRAHDEGVPVHVWVDETRPRNQGASLTAWELAEHGVPHTIIADNVGGHLMQHGMVDLCLVGSDRTTANGDVCNKIGTYLKALAAHDNGVPFYAAVPSPTIDWTLGDGVRDIPIEQRDGSEVRQIAGRAEDGRIVTVQLTPSGSPVANYAFDVTPARLVTGIVTERGIALGLARRSGRVIPRTSRQGGLSALLAADAQHAAKQTTAAAGIARDVAPQRAVQLGEMPIAQLHPRRQRIFDEQGRLQFFDAAPF